MVQYTGSTAALCETTGKNKYVTRHLAHRAKKRVKQRDHRKTYPYLCQHCGFWHLSHYKYSTRQTNE